jgi:hypothetical protein
MENVSLKEVSLKSKIALLKELGFGSDNEFVLNKDGIKLLDRYSNSPVKINNMAILHGDTNTIILNDCVFSLTHYIEEFPSI